MLPPEYFYQKEIPILRIYQNLEDFIIKDIARRLLQAGRFTATADRLIWKLNQMGQSRASIERKLQEVMNMSEKELRKILQNAVLTSWNNEKEILLEFDNNIKSPMENPEIINLIDAEWKKTAGELYNLTRTTMDQSQKDLIQLMDEAEVRVSGGVQSYTAAVNAVLDDYAGKGMTVEYPSGTVRSLEAAVRCCVVTSMNQTAAQMTNRYIVQAKTNYVLVSAHIGARVAKEGQPICADHAEWQGKAYCITGEEPGYPNLLESTGYDINPSTGEGTVVNPLGLHGYNCRHSHQPWAKGMKNPWEDEKHRIDQEENKKFYENMQKQRAMERSIRKTKRQLIKDQEMLNSDTVPDSEKKKIQEKYDQRAYKLTEQNRKYNSFCKTNGMVPQYERNRVADFDYIQQTNANKGAKRYMKG